MLLLLLYCLYCRSVYSYRLHVLVLHLFTTSPSTFIVYRFLIVAFMLQIYNICTLQYQVEHQGG